MKIIYLQNEWTVAKTYIEKKIILLLKKKKKINFFLTGGSTASKFYPFLSKKLIFYKNKINFFLTDERYVKKNSKLLNSNLIKKKCFKNAYNIKNFYFNLYKSKNRNIEKKIYSYEKNFKNIDIILLSLANDGHIAGLFNSYYDKSSKDKYFYFKKKNENFIRISLSKKFISKAKYLFILVNGGKRFKIFNKIVNSPKVDYPASNFKNQAIWLVNKTKI